MPTLNPSSGVSVGLATKLGLLGTVAALVASVVDSIQHNQALLTGTGKPAGLLASAFAIAVVLARSYQAAHIEKPSAVAGAISDLPNELVALAGEADANLVKVQASPDHVDGPGVAFSGQPEEGQGVPQPLVPPTGAPAPPAPPAA